MAKLIMMVGIPGCGKSTKANELALEYNATVYSSDDLREKLFGNINEQEKNKELFAYIHTNIKNDLRNGKNVIYDACNINSKKRKAFLDELKNIDCEKECVIVARTYENCIKANLERDRVVPIDVIKRMYMNWTTPQFYEGWDNISFSYTDNEQEKYGYPELYVDRFKNYDQHNEHHGETLGEHLERSAKYLENKNESIDMYITACIHDCGKPFCRTYKNRRDEIGDEAHYYSHENVGAYNSMFFKTKVDKLYMAFIINNHMKPLDWERNNSAFAPNKYKKLWGNKLYEDIMKFRDADVAARDIPCKTTSAALNTNIEDAINL